MMKTVKGYRFVTDDLQSEHGNTQWEIGKWQKLDNDEPLALCQNGFHASQKPIDSLNYVFGTRWFTCEARGKILKDDDKFCAIEMRLVNEIPNRVIEQFAIDCAWRILPIFEQEYPNDKRPRLAIKAARQYLKFPTQENLDKLTAARAAAGDAAGAAARAAAWAAARAAETKWQTRHLLNLIRKENDGRDN
jgi:hypothetical protein